MRHGGAGSLFELPIIQTLAVLRDEAGEAIRRTRIGNAAMHLRRVRPETR